MANKPVTKRYSVVRGPFSEDVWVAVSAVERLTDRGTSIEQGLRMAGSGPRCQCLTCTVSHLQNSTGLRLDAVLTLWRTLLSLGCRPRVWFYRTGVKRG